VLQVSADIDYRQDGAWAAGLATLSQDGRILDSYYPAPRLGIDEAAERVAASYGHQGTGTIQLDAVKAAGVLGADVYRVIGEDARRQVSQVVVATFISALADPPVDAHDVYLRLHLLSHRLVRPHETNLDGVFGLLSTVVWTSIGPCPVADFEAVRLRCLAAGEPISVYGVDKFPRMVDYVLPTGVRIADADRVRLGAHLAEGTTVMHEGFVNFNAGTLGTSMVEGRISSGVVVGDGSDIGGGASVMGTLSGGGKERVSIGRNCLLGANSGIGISLGDDCVVEAGLYVTAGTKVGLPDGTVVKAAELSGRDGLLFRRDSQSGAVQALPRGAAWGRLNADLHRND